MTTSVEKMVDELLRLATEREQEATRLREAAAVLQTRPVTPKPAGTGHTPMSAAGVPEAVYLEHLRRKPAPWTSGELYASLVEAGLEINGSAVRTMLYRLEKRGLVKRTAPGRFAVVAHPEGR